MEQKAGTTNDNTALAEVNRPEVERVTKSIEQGNTVTHIYGELGSMSDDVLTRAKTSLTDSTTRTFHVSEVYDTDYLTQQIARELYDTLSTQSKLRFKLQSASISTPFLGGGLGTDNPFDRPIDLLRRVAQRVSTDTVVFIHDVHSLSAPDTKIEAALREIEQNLPQHIAVVTSGENRFDEVHSIQATPLSKEQFTGVVTDTWEDVTPEEAERVYNAAEGMPLYLGLLIETHGSDDDFEISRISDEATDILEDYVTSLSTQEQEFLRATSMLMELDEQICANLTGLSRVEASDMLRGLAGQLAIREVGRRDDLKRYKIRRDIQSYLYTRAADTKESHRKLFRYYLDELFEKEDEGLLGRSIYPGMLCVYHLAGSVGDDLNSSTIKEEIDSLNLAVEQKMELCLSILPYFCFKQVGAERALFEILDDIRDEIQQRYPDEFELNQLVGIDAYRIAFRLLLPKTNSGSSKGLQYYEEAAEINEETLAFIANESDEEHDFGFWVVGLRLTGAYAHSKCGNDDRVEALLEPVFQQLEWIGISRSVAKGVYQRTEKFVTQLELNDILQELLASELDDTFGALSGQQSAKQYLFEAKGDVGSAFETTGASVFEELQNHPAEFTRYVDDLAALIAPFNLDEELAEYPEFARTRGFQLRSLALSCLYTLTSQMGLYQQLYSKYRGYDTPLERLKERK